MLTLLHIILLIKCLKVCLKFLLQFKSDTTKLFWHWSLVFKRFIFEYDPQDLQQSQFGKAELVLVREVDNPILVIAELQELQLLVNCEARSITEKIDDALTKKKSKHVTAVSIRYKNLSKQTDYGFEHHFLSAFSKQVIYVHVYGKSLLAMFSFSLLLP